MAALFAFLHHFAAFALAAAVAVESALAKDELTPNSARSLLRADLVFGLAAAFIIAVGVLRVFYFEKGAAYYAHSIPFIVKMSLFAIVGLLSIYPTREFLSWRKSLREGVLPVVAEAKMGAIRTVIRLELGCVVLIILCAVLMARGVGYVGWAVASGPIERAHDGAAAAVQHVSVDHSRAHIRMARAALLEARKPADFEAVFATAATKGIEAVVVSQDPMLLANSKAIAEIAAKNRLPSIGRDQFAEAGGMIGFSPKLANNGRARLIS